MGKLSDELDAIRRMPDMKDDVFIFPPTAEEQRAIEDHILWVTNSKTKRTKAFKTLLEKYMKTWVAYIRTHSMPIYQKDRHGWPWPMNEVMCVVLEAQKNE